MQVGNPCNRRAKIDKRVNVSGAGVRVGPHGRTKRWLNVEAEGEQVTIMNPKFWVSGWDGTSIGIKGIKY